MNIRHLNITILIILSLVSLSADSYKKIQIYFTDRAELQQIYRSNLDIDHAELQSDNSIIVFLGEREYRRLVELGFQYKVLIDDWQTFYRNRQKMSALAKRIQLNESAQNFGVTGFTFGSMGGFYTFDEIVAELDSMHLKYPEIITEKFSIGQSVEGREMWAVKISDHPDQNEAEPQICFDALLHAREPGGMATVMYFMDYLLENYGQDPVVTHLVNNREIYFLPCLNPDGYEYNRSTDPNGGGMWRKNRRDSIGVDLNRNWDLAWGLDNDGSSPVPSSETYRGPSAFSEPESYNFAEFIKSKNIKTHINYHTYSNIILYPWSYTAEQPPDSTILFEYARDISKNNGYDYGNGNAIGYFSNGTESDWIYSKQPDKENIYSFVFEVGRASDGFWAAEDRIIPLAEKNIAANLYLCWIPEAYAAIAGHSFNQSVFLPGDTVDLDLYIKNRGLAAADNIQVRFADISGYLDFADLSVDINPLNVWQQDTLRTRFTIKDNLPAALPIQLTVRTYYDELPMDVDTLSIYIGNPTVVFHESANISETGWDYNDSTSSTGWEITDEKYNSAPSAYTDSKNTLYSSNSTAILTMIEPINLNGYDSPRLSFWTRYEIESNWDCGYVQLSTDSGASWITLKGIYTDSGTGSGRQVKNRPVYDGFQPDWVREDIDLSEFSEKSILLRFVLSSDDYLEYDGWYIDDIRIYYYSIENPNGSKSDPLSDFTFSLEQNYPNPFNPCSVIQYQLAQPGPVNLIIYNLRGEKVVALLNTYQQAGQHHYNLDINSMQPALSSGIYFYVLKTDLQQRSRKMIILK